MIFSLSQNFVNAFKKAYGCSGFYGLVDYLYCCICINYSLSIGFSTRVV
ncbi:hypothetical protein PALI_a1064 [Pseudoalteromonas aliena SW19]|uniref:Uncharacterized protein n=1 Tax=Pseudoalteromonas aliena SW19 TaxID=1314866 RepID=A0ABR9DZY3_9GAMM|nr:hypothetical protein [Pseudoalteromonas aliena SW19]